MTLLPLHTHLVLSFFRERNSSFYYFSQSPQFIVLGRPDTLFYRPICFPKKLGLSSVCRLLLPSRRRFKDCPYYLLQKHTR